MYFSKLWQQCRAGDTSACRKIYLFYYLLPRLDQMFRNFQLGPPIVIPRPLPQPDPVPYERLLGEAELFEQFAMSKVFSAIKYPVEEHIKTLELLNDEIVSWSSEVQKEIKVLKTKTKHPQEAIAAS